MKQYKEQSQLYQAAALPILVFKTPSINVMLCFVGAIKILLKEINCEQKINKYQTNISLKKWKAEMQW